MEAATQRRETLESLTRTRQWAHQTLLKHGSQVYQAFLDLEHAAFADGALPKKTKELIAIGIDALSPRRGHDGVGWESSRLP
ncbi:MAG: carboxymuconolactone decarboxylase family protein [Gammaproteobacteria bacterium]|nr:carboxymuconolactone decarboxylase family protein [Gammaproteobacteria bacterium]